MRFTDVVYKNKNDYELCEAVNILSVKMGSLDIDFPIHVYGTVIARDMTKSVFISSAVIEKTPKLSTLRYVTLLKPSCLAHGD